MLWNIWSLALQSKVGKTSIKSRQSEATREWALTSSSPDWNIKVCPPVGPNKSNKPDKFIYYGYAGLGGQTASTTIKGDKNHCADQIKNISMGSIAIPAWFDNSSLFVQQFTLSPQTGFACFCWREFGVQFCDIRARPPPVIGNFLWTRRNEKWWCLIPLIMRSTLVKSTVRSCIPLRKKSIHLMNKYDCDLCGGYKQNRAWGNKIFFFKVWQTVHCSRSHLLNTFSQLMMGRNISARLVIIRQQRRIFSINLSSQKIWNRTMTALTLINGSQRKLI